MMALNGIKNSFTYTFDLFFAVVNIVNVMSLLFLGMWILERIVLVGVCLGVLVEITLSKISSYFVIIYKKIRERFKTLKKSIS